MPINVAFPVPTDATCYFYFLLIQITAAPSQKKPIIDYPLSEPSPVRVCANYNNVVRRG